MPTYKITSTGNTIVAEQSFMDSCYPNDYALQPESPAPLQPVAEPLDHMSRFTETELAGIYTAAKSLVQALESSGSVPKT